MTDFSGLVALDADELGRPTGLKAMTADDTISSSILTRNVRNAVSGIDGVSATVSDNSGAWTGGGVSADGYENWNAALDTVSSTTDGSAYWVSAYSYSLCAWDTVSATSATWTGGGGVSADGYENWNAALDTVSSTTDGSAFWVSAYNYSLCAWDTVSATSGAWTGGGNANVDTAVSARWEDTFENVRDTSSLRDRVLNYITDGSGYIGEVSSFVVDSSGDLVNASGTFETFSGNMETSAAGLSSIVDAFSGNVETSVVTIDGDITTNTTNIGSIDSRVTTVESQVPSAVGYSDWDRTTAYVTNASSDLENASSTFETFSSTMETSTAGLSSIVDAFSGNVETSVVDLDTSTDALNVWSGSVEASTATLDAQVPSAPGFAGWDSTESTVTSKSGDWDNAATWGDVSSTKCLGGTAPAATVSAITVSACPVPAPWIYVQQTDDEQSTVDQTDFYFGGNAADAGTSPATTSYELSPELITWVPTYPEHILIAATGYYEVIFYGSFYLPAGSNNPTTITQQLQTSAMSIETTRISKVLQMRNNAEPTDAGLHWIGYLMAGDKLGIQITADATTNLREGSTFTCKRIN